MGLTQTKLHFKILKEKWPGVVYRLETPRGLAEARTRNPLGDLPLHYACYTGRAPPFVLRALLVAYPEGIAVRNKEGFLPLELAEVNYRRDGPHRGEALGILRAATAVSSAAASTGENGPPAAAAPAAAAAVPEEVYRTSATCVVCLDAPATQVVVPCGHLCLCSGCAPQVLRRKMCPVGRCFVGNIVLAEEGMAAASSRSGSCGESGTSSCGGSEMGSVAGEVPSTAVLAR